MKILIVEDSMLYQKAIVKYLGEHLPEAEFFIATDGLEGYKLYQQETPDFVLLDLLLPTISGQELLKLIKEINPQVNAIVISADVQRIIQEELNNLGILKFINKPFTPDKAEQLACFLKEV